MSFAVADRVRETTVTTGTGPLNLGGAVPQFQSFVAGVGSGNNCEYTLLSGDGINWEVGLGTVTSGTPNTLSRDTVLSSSNSNALISLIGVTGVFLTRSAASYRAMLDAPIVPPLLAANWTQKGFVTNVTLTDAPNGLVLQDANANGSAVYRLTGASLAAPTPPYTIDARIRANLAFANASSAGIGFTDGTKCQAMLHGITTNAAPFAGGGPSFRVTSFSSFSTSTFASDQFDQNYFPSAVFWARIRDDNAGNVYFSFSLDGVNFIQPYSVAKASGYLGASGYTNVAFCLVSGVSQVLASLAVLESWWQH